MKKKLLITALSLMLAFTSISFCYADESIDSASGNAEIETTTQAAVNIKTVSPQIKVTSYSYNKLKVSWETVSGADGYEVCRKTTKAGKYKKVKTVGEDKTSYINTGLTCGKTYWYKVRAYKTEAGKKVYSKYSVVKSAYPRPSKVKNLEAIYSSDAYSDFDLEWNKTTGATGYQIQIKPSSKSLWSSYYREKLTSGGWSKTYPDEWNDSKYRYDVKYITLGTEAHWRLPSCEDSYSFRVRAYRTVNGKKVFGLYSEPFTLYPVWKSGDEVQDFVHTWVDDNYPTYDRELEERINADVYPEKDGVNWGTQWTWSTISQYDTKEYILDVFCKKSLAGYFHAWWGYENETTGILYTRDLGDGTWQVWWIN